VTPKTRRQLGLLGLLIAIGIALVLWQRPAADIAGSGTAVPGAAGVQSGGRGDVVGDIRLELLEGRAEGRRALERNLFQFAPRPAPSAQRIARGPAGPPIATGPPPPVPPPPIPLRYIGYLDQAGRVPRVAVLSDGRGNVFNGREGDIIEGRYRVLRIGVDSADLIYVDGRGRQTIRLSGQ